MNFSQNIIRTKTLTGLLIAIVLISITTSLTRAQSSTVNAVIFFSPSCPHCHKVIGEDLPLLLIKYGSNLNILGINVATPQGQELYISAIDRFQIPEEKRGVPALIVGNTLLVGSLEIPEQLPGIIEAGLSSGGITLPDIPGLDEALNANQGEASEDSTVTKVSPQAMLDNPPALAFIANDTQSTAQIQQTSIVERFTSDLTGNILSVIVLVGMVACVAVVGINAKRGVQTKPTSIPAWVTPVLAIVGMLVAGYLSYIEITQSKAVCGPVGNCNAVQQSEYARLFGFLPVGVLGFIGYLMILILWIVQTVGSKPQKRYATIGLGLLSLGGIAFSIYLTFLEPFVIGATCAWCITSAIIMTLLFWITSTPALVAWREGRRKRRRR
jgi:uncharacterized membrane protein